MEDKRPVSGTWTVCVKQITNWESYDDRLLERACKPLHKHRTINRPDIRIGPEHALVCKSIVCLNLLATMVSWEGNDRKLKCAGT